MFLPDFLKIAYELQNVGKVLITEPENDDSWLLSRQGTFHVRLLRNFLPEVIFRKVGVGFL